MTIPEYSSAAEICPTVADGIALLRTAHAPVTCGAACEVPFIFAKVLTGTEEYMLTPGAKKI